MENEGVDPAPALSEALASALPADAPPHPPISFGEVKDKFDRFVNTYYAFAMDQEADEEEETATLEDFRTKIGEIIERKVVSKSKIKMMTGELVELKLSIEEMGKASEELKKAFEDKDKASEESNKRLESSLDAATKEIADLTKELAAEKEKGQAK